MCRWPPPSNCVGSGILVWHGCNRVSFSTVQLMTTSDGSSARDMLCCCCCFAVQLSTLHWTLSWTLRMAAARVWWHCAWRTARCTVSTHTTQCWPQAAMGALTSQQPARTRAQVKGHSLEGSCMGCCCVPCRTAVLAVIRCLLLSNQRTHMHRCTAAVNTVTSHAWRRKQCCQLP